MVARFVTSTASRKRAALSVGIAALVLGGGYFAYTRHRSSVAQATFAPLLRRLDAGTVAMTTPPALGTERRVLVAVREAIGGPTGGQTRYHVVTGLGWNVPWARTQSEVGVVLLVDRIGLDIRSYYPRGDDYQIVLHCRLVDPWSGQALSDFVVRGTRPGDRSGWSTFAGLMDRLGSEPWREVGTRVEARLAQH